jgi:hypothetical protein
MTICRDFITKPISTTTATTAVRTLMRAAGLLSEAGVRLNSRMLTAFFRDELDDDMPALHYV